MDIWEGCKIKSPKVWSYTAQLQPSPTPGTHNQHFCSNPLDITSMWCGGNDGWIVIILSWNYFFLVEANWNICSFLNKLHRFHQKANLWHYDGCIMRRHGPDPNQLLWKSDRSPLGHFPLLIGGLHNYQSLTSQSNEDLWIDGVKNARVLPRWSFEFKPRKDLTWAAI